LSGWEEEAEAEAEVEMEVEEGGKGRSNCSAGEEKTRQSAYAKRKGADTAEQIQSKMAGRDRMKPVQ